MRQTIVDMNIWEAFEKNTECPVCSIENEHENKLLNIFYSEMVMDGEFCMRLGRDYSFCRNHFEKLYRYPDKLGLAIVMEKFLLNQRDLMKMSPGSCNMKETSIFTRSVVSKIFHRRHERSFLPVNCFICSKLDEGVEMDIDVLISLWKENEEFRDLYIISKGFCMNHYNSILEASHIVMGDEAGPFIEATFKIQKMSLERLENELKGFIDRFDYRFRYIPMGQSSDSLPRSIFKLTGNFTRH